MTIEGYDRPSFGRKINTMVFPAQPIRSIEHLFGRDKELDRIEKALYAGGRNIFIYGDRGVGKSSLAATAANQYQSAENNYIDIACSPDATLTTVVANIAYQASNTSRIRNVKRQGKLTTGFKYLKVEVSSESSCYNLHDKIRTLTDAIEVLREVALLHSNKAVVVVDEFDRMQSMKQRNLFADLLKHIGDKEIDIKFIFTGVGKTLFELLGAHESAIRQLETIELPKLGWEARWQIVIDALATFGIEIDRDIYIRIATISDGYPYYVHLIAEKLLWFLYDKTEPVTRVSWDDYHLALRNSIESISAELRRPYEMAVNQRSNDYEEVLWSTADSDNLLRYLKNIYRSYKRIMKQLPAKESLSYAKFSNRIRNLKKQDCGSVLIAENRPGLYSYRVKMLRGYVRMQAEANGIELAGELAGEEGRKQYIRVKTGTKRYRGYH